MFKAIKINACPDPIDMMYAARPFGFIYVREIIAAPIAYVNKRKSPLKYTAPPVRSTSIINGDKKDKTVVFNELLSKTTYKINNVKLIDILTIVI